MGIDERTVRVIHDLKREILEVPSLFRVMENYYRKKSSIQEKIEPLLKRKIQEGLKSLQTEKDWLFSIPTTFSSLSDEVAISSKDSFRFPDSIILFEAWMNLGMEALYPRFVLHFKFPGLLRGEKTRNVFQFIYATSRGFGFPLNFGPEFYGYKLTVGKILEPLFRWGHTAFHRVNQAINLIEARINAKRHHPGEFESVIISEYENNFFKGIDTLLHGYYTNDPKRLGIFKDLDELLDNVSFSYTIGDHAMSVENKIFNRTIPVKLISHQEIVQKFDIDFYSYIEKLMLVVRLINKKIKSYKQKKKVLINDLKFLDKVKFRFDQSKRISIPWLKKSKNFVNIYKYDNYNNLLEKLRNLIWTTPLYMHTVHDQRTREEHAQFDVDKDELDEFGDQTQDSLLLAFVKQYERKHRFEFVEEDVIAELKNLRDHMAKMWLYFKERYYRYAKKKLNEIAKKSLQDPEYNKQIRDALEKLIPIISLFEIFHRPLSESAFPEANPYTKSAFAVSLFRFLTSRYNPIGLNLMRLFNLLAFRNWSYYIIKNKLSFEKFFNTFLKLPMWDHIPKAVKNKILNNA